MLLAGVSLIFLVRGLKRSFGQPRVYRGKILSSILALVALLLVGVAIFSCFQARAIPASAGAPKVGQTATDFTLADTSGQSVSMAQLFAPAADDSQVAPPKAVLLIFYRGLRRQASGRRSAWTRPRSRAIYAGRQVALSPFFPIQTRR